MNIVFTINKLSHFGGTERVVSILASEMSKLGHNVYVITQESEKTVYTLDEAVTIVATKVNTSIPLIRAFKREVKLRSMIKNLSPDIVLSFLTDMNVLTILACLGLKIPILVSERSDPKKTKFIWKILRKIFYYFASGYVFQTNEVYNMFSKKIREKSRVIFNPIFSNIPMKTDFRLKNRIISVGRLEKQKNQIFLIKEFKKIVNKYPDMKLDIYGSGSLEEILKKEIIKYKLLDSISIKTPVANIQSLMINYDMFVLTSNYEGMPNSLAEALCMGMPCLASNCPAGGVSELIDNGYNGLMYNLGQPSQFCEQFELLVSNPDYRKKLSYNTKKIRSKLTATNIVEQWLNFMNLIIEEKKC